MEKYLIKEDDTNYIIPIQLNAEDLFLSDALVNYWKDTGYLLVDGLLSKELIEQCIYDVVMEDYHLLIIKTQQKNT